LLFSGFRNASDEEEPPPENDTEDEGDPDPFAPFASLPTDDPLHQGGEVIWDFVFDIMHAADAFKRYVVPTMKGERRPTMLLLATDGHVGAELERRKTKNRETRRDHDSANKVSNIFFFFEITIYNALIMHYVLR
jgi:hypothetical protein